MDLTPLLKIVCQLGHHGKVQVQSESRCSKSVFTDRNCRMGFVIGIAACHCILRGVLCHRVVVLGEYPKLTGETVLWLVSQWANNWGLGIGRAQTLFEGRFIYGLLTLFHASIRR
jgi:hypothetical protein